MSVYLFHGARFLLGACVRDCAKFIHEDTKNPAPDGGAG
jgi:hypothetical protein